MLPNSLTVRTQLTSLKRCALIWIAIWLWECSDQNGSRVTESTTSTSEKFFMSFWPKGSVFYLKLLLDVINNPRARYSIVLNVPRRLIGRLSRLEISRYIRSCVSRFIISCHFFLHFVVGNSWNKRLKTARGFCNYNNRWFPIKRLSVLVVNHQILLHFLHWSLTSSISVLSLY